LEQVRKEHAEREKQEAQDREIKRRQEAKLMQEAKQDRKDKENKVYFDKLRKEKMEDEAHRKRVRQQIATDRAEKIAQRNAEKERKNSITPPPPFVDEKSNGSSSSSINHEFSNLNIRQLNGTNIRNKFEGNKFGCFLLHYLLVY
jgi:recombination DNA repair RAD52 pathway protein